MGRQLSIALLLLALAAPADAAKVCLAGDSHMRGGLTSPGFGGRATRWNTANVLTSLSAHTIVDYSVPATAPEDWIQAPGLATACVGIDDPWACCTGSGTGSDCVCDGAVPGTYYPWLDAACDTRTSIVSHLPTDCARWLLLGDGAVATTASAAVDDIETLVAQLDAIDTGSGVRVSSPPHFGTAGTCGLSVLGYDDVYAEMALRGDVITGPDFYADFPETNRCVDGIHPTGAAYAWWGAAWLGFLP